MQLAAKQLAAERERLERYLATSDNPVTIRGYHRPNRQSSELRPPCEVDGMIILCDVDGVICDFVGGLCARLEEYGYKRTPEDFFTYNIAECDLSDPEMAIINGASREPGFCAKLPWYEDGREFLHSLGVYGDVYAITAPWRSNTWDSERRQWLGTYLSPERVLSVAGDSKRLIAGDVLIEDRAPTVQQWLEAHPNGRAILIDRPWNRYTGDHPRMKRANDYDEAIELVRKWSRL
jgi:5'(3')-deoxyribonucleotidase